MKHAKLAGGLRITTALTIVAAIIAAGWLHRSPWLVAFVTPVFTVLYALGKWNAWTAAWRVGGAKQIVLATVLALPIQAVVAGVFYLVGLGLGRLFTGYAPIAALSTADAIGAGVLFAVGVAISAAIIRLEGAPSRSPDAEVNTATEKPELDIAPTPLTLGTVLRVCRLLASKCLTASAGKARRDRGEAAARGERGHDRGR